MARGRLAECQPAVPLSVAAPSRWTRTVRGRQPATECGNSGWRSIRRRTCSRARALRSRRRRRPIGYGSTITIQTTQTSRTKWVSLIRPAAVTHSLNTDQRVVNVPFTVESGNTLRLTVPSNPIGRASRLVHVVREQLVRRSERREVGAPGLSPGRVAPLKPCDRLAERNEPASVPSPNWRHPR